MHSRMRPAHSARPVGVTGNFSRLDRPDCRLHFDLVASTSIQSVEWPLVWDKWRLCALSASPAFFAPENIFSENPHHQLRPAQSSLT